MSFRLTFSLTFASSHSDNPSKGVLKEMGDWIDDEANRAKSEDEARTRRQKLFIEQTAWLWSDLQRDIERDVEKINHNQELLSRRLGGEKLRFIDLGSEQIEVTKLGSPMIRLTLTNRGDHISAERMLTINGQAGRPRQELDKLSINLDPNDRLFLRNEQGVDLQVSEISQYMLTPLIRST